LSPQSAINKQGRSGESLPDDVANRVLEIMKTDAMNCYNHYIEMMNEDDKGNIIDENNIGITRELARINLTLNMYTEWYWKINLHNLLHFLALRADEHAQYEIRVYARAMLDIVKAWVPYAYEAFEDHKMYATTISKKGMEVVRGLIQGKKIDQESSGMSQREWGELMVALQLNNA
jgi:thymidylate synthase (FAD)